MCTFLQDTLLISDFGASCPHLPQKPSAPTSMVYFILKGETGLAHWGLLELRLCLISALSTSTWTLPRSQQYPQPTACNMVQASRAQWRWHLSQSLGSASGTEILPWTLASLGRTGQCKREAQGQGRTRHPEPPDILPALTGWVTLARVPSPG